MANKQTNCSARASIRVGDLVQLAGRVISEDSVWSKRDGMVGVVTQVLTIDENPTGWSATLIKDQVVVHWSDGTTGKCSSNVLSTLVT